MKELIARLRNLNTVRSDGLFNLCDQAADALEAQELRIKELEESTTPHADLVKKIKADAITEYLARKAAMSLGYVRKREV